MKQKKKTNIYTCLVVYVLILKLLEPKLCLILTLLLAEQEKQAPVHIGKPCIWNSHEHQLEDCDVASTLVEGVEAEQSQGEIQSRIHQCEQNYPHEARFQLLD